MIRICGEIAQLLRSAGKYTFFFFLFGLLYLFCLFVCHRLHVFLSMFQRLSVSFSIYSRSLSSIPPPPPPPSSLSYHVCVHACVYLLPILKSEFWFFCFFFLAEHDIEDESLGKNYSAIEQDELLRARSHVCHVSAHARTCACSHGSLHSVVQMQLVHLSTKIVQNKD